VTTLYPPARLGFVGGGQLARMMAVEARRMGYGTVVLDPDPDCPAAQVCERSFQGSLADPATLEAFAAAVDVATLDHEHIPAAQLEALAARTHVRPSPRVLGIVQDRLVQREFVASLGVPGPGFMAVSDRASLEAAVHRFGYPLVLKTRREGYDGKGQLRVKSAADLPTAEAFVTGAEVLAESFVRFEREISVVLARGLRGEIAVYPIADNVHERHVLRTTVAPADVPAQVADAARAIAVRIAEAFDYVGVIAVEMFLTRSEDGGAVLVNEIAPRVHNSGHYTQGACVTNQFEQHVRAVMGLPLGDARLVSPAVMVNLFGDLWGDGAPSFAPVLERPEAKLHLYGKRSAKPGRKMGHVVVLAPTRAEAEAEAKALRAALER
jgi:5-(carboxyamino)imidazole ribonucleotide synthase